MANARYGEWSNYALLLLNILLVSLLTSVIAATMSWGLGLFEPLGIFSGLITAAVVSGVFVWSMNIREGEESFVDSIPVIIVSVALISFLRTGGLEIIPSIVTKFTWMNLAVLLSSVWLSDSIVRTYILEAE